MVFKFEGYLGVLACDIEVKGVYVALEECVSSSEISSLNALRSPAFVESYAIRLSKGASRQIGGTDRLQQLSNAFSEVLLRQSRLFVCYPGLPLGDIDCLSAIRLTHRFVFCASQSRPPKVPPLM